MNPPLHVFPAVDPARGRAIAEAYARLPVNVYGADRETTRAYDALAAELPAHYARACARFDVRHVATDPYRGSGDMVADMLRGRLRVFAGGAPHPVLSARGLPRGIGPAHVNLNDALRAVHDVQHFDLRAGFSASGEDAVYRAHREAFGPLATRALATETRGQNSVYNFGPAPGTYAVQKVAVLPGLYVWTDRD